MGGIYMTKKGIVLSIVLVILVASIVIIIAKQNMKPTDVNQRTETEQEQTSDFTLEVTASKGIELDKLKSYHMPILIQFR